MAAITPAMIKELRERTSAGMSDCKNALVEAEGDLDKAVEVILKKGLVKAASRAGKVATEGEVATWVSPDGKKGVIVEVNSQTDFVSRGDDFKTFVKTVLEVASKLPKGADLASQPYPGSDKTIDVVRQDLVGRIGENIVVRRWDVLEAALTRPFLRMTSTALSRSPSASTSAFLQSDMPAEVRSRSSLIIAGVIAISNLSVQEGRFSGVTAGAAAASGGASERGPRLRAYCTSAWGRPPRPPPPWSSSRL